MTSTDKETKSDPVEVMDSEALAELRDWLLNGAPCVSGGTYAAGVVSQRDIFKLFAHIDALSAKSQAAEAAGWVISGWQQIETAPEEIKPLWLAHAETGVTIVGIRHKWIAGAWRNYWGDRTLSFTPTHWMSLPQPPAASLTPQEKEQKT